MRALSGGDTLHTPEPGSWGLGGYEGDPSSGVGDAVESGSLEATGRV